MEYLVDILMPVYNHEPYLKEALEGIANQKTDFNFRLLIGEDFSTDKSREIIYQYQAKFPKIIFPFFRDENLGAFQNSQLLFAEANSKYIALCEGDDFWINTSKLQQQINFLEENDDYAICFHGIYEQIGDVRKPSPHNISDIDRTYTIVDLARYNFISTPSVVYRNGLYEKLPSWYNQAPVGDYIIHLLNAKKGNLKYFAELMAVYRKHSGGIWSNHAQKTSSEKWIKLLDFLLTEQFSEEVIHELKSQRRYTINGYLKFFLEEGNEKDFLQKMEEFSKSDPLIKEEWLTTYYIKYINELKQAKTYRLAQKLASLKNLVKKGTGN